MSVPQRASIFIPTGWIVSDTPATRERQTALCHAWYLDHENGDSTIVEFNPPIESGDDFYARVLTRWHAGVRLSERDAVLLCRILIQRHGAEVYRWPKDIREDLQAFLTAQN